MKENLIFLVFHSINKNLYNNKKTKNISLIFGASGLWRLEILLNEVHKILRNKERFDNAMNLGMVNSIYTQHSQGIYYKIYWWNLKNLFLSGEFFAGTHVYFCVCWKFLKAR